MSVSEAASGVVDESVDSTELAPGRLRSDRVHRRGRRVLTSTAATLTEGTWGQACSRTLTSMWSSA